MPSTIEKRQWKVAEKLHKAMPLLDAEAVTKALSLIKWHSEHGTWSQKQEAFALALAYKAKGERTRRRIAKNVPHYLYAISDGSAVKLGFSRRPKERLRSMQTGQSAHLKLLWELLAGDSPAKAMRAERQLHRFCRAHRKRGEWFSLDCMDMVRLFEVKESKNERRRARGNV
jgi:hypothetical protein